MPAAQGKSWLACSLPVHAFRRCSVQNQRRSKPQSLVLRPFPAILRIEHRCLLYRLRMFRERKTGSSAIRREPGTTIFSTRYMARQVGSEEIETEHLLLGLLRSDN